MTTLKNHSLLPPHTHIQLSELRLKKAKKCDQHHTANIEMELGPPNIKSSAHSMM